MTQHDKEVIEATVNNAEHSQTLQDGSQKDTHAPRLSKRAQAALESADPLTESLLAKVLGNQVCMDGTASTRPELTIHRLLFTKTGLSIRLKVLKGSSTREWPKMCASLGLPVATDHSEWLS